MVMSYELKQDKSNKRIQINNDKNISINIFYKAHRNNLKKVIVGEK